MLPPIGIRLGPSDGGNVPRISSLGACHALGTDVMSYASDVTPEEAARGFEPAEHAIFGRIVVARIGHGLFALKTVTDDGAVRYQICDERGTTLYPAAGSLFDLERRFGLGDLKSA